MKKILRITVIDDFEGQEFIAEQPLEEGDCVNEIAKEVVEWYRMEGYEVSIEMMEIIDDVKQI